MVDGLHIVAVGVKNARREIGWVVWPEARCTIVYAACRNGHRVEALDLLLRLCLNGQVNVRSRTRRRVHEELIRLEPSIAFAIERQQIQGFQGGLVEATAHVQVRDAQVNMIQQASEVVGHARCS
jgi:hypothetical protein